MEAPQAQGPPPELQRDKPVGPLENVARTADFWRRTLVIYAGYKACQAQALALRALGWDEARLKDEHWAHQHSKAAQQMYSLCVDLRGFYLKVQMGVLLAAGAAAASLRSLPAAGCPLLSRPTLLSTQNTNKIASCPCPCLPACRAGSSSVPAATLCPSRSAASCRCCTTRCGGVCCAVVWCACLLHACLPVLGDSTAHSSSMAAQSRCKPLGSAWHLLMSSAIVPPPSPHFCSAGAPDARRASACCD
jgi:hypothetical protein